MNITYTEREGVLIPDLQLPAQEEVSLGVWAMRRKNYLMNHRKVMYYNLLTSCRLTEHLSQTERQAQEMMGSIVEKMKNQQNLTEELKMKDPMKWTQMMNNIRQSAKEIVMQELIYS
ncbi:MAG: TnpV protein [Anaerovoracaceae bacterium]